MIFKAKKCMFWGRITSPQAYPQHRLSVVSWRFPSPTFPSAHKVSTPPFSLSNFKSTSTLLKVCILTTDQVYTNLFCTVLLRVCLHSFFLSLHILSLYQHKLDILNTYPITFQFFMDSLIVHRLSNVCMK